jgi:hypothetical protein
LSRWEAKAADPSPTLTVIAINRVVLAFNRTT